MHVMIKNVYPNKTEISLSHSLISCAHAPTHIVSHMHMLSLSRDNTHIHIAMLTLYSVLLIGNTVGRSISSVFMLMESSSSILSTSLSGLTLSTSGCKITN
jgi:hypothetical protein